MSEAPIYRRSELEAIDEGCLHRYKAIWIDGAPDESDDALVGIGFHKVKYRYITALVAAQIPQDAEIARQAFIEGIALAQTPSRLIPAVHDLWDWHAESFELPLDQFVAAEEKQVRGPATFTPDLVTANPRINELEIHDDKSGWAPPLTEDELRQLYQARFYTLFGREQWPGFSSYRFTLHAIRFRRDVSVVFTAEDLDRVRLEVEANIATLVQATRTNQWPAVPGPSCRFCTLQCPVANHPMIVPKRLQTLDQAGQVASWLLAAEAITKAAKKALKAYVAAHGPLTVNRMVWAHREVLQRAYPLLALVDALKVRNALDLEHPEQQGLTVSHSALKKLFIALPELENDLRTVVQETTRHRFGAKQFESQSADGDDE